jgi:hypothetical protein
LVEDTIFRLLGGMRLLSVGAFDALAAGADRQGPVRAHLKLVIQRFHGLIVECVFLLRILGRPDQRLMRVGEAAALEVGHGIGFAPHHVIEDPEAQVLQRGADAENVVIGADHPQRAGILQAAARRHQPFAGEAVIDFKGTELVPMIVDRIHLGLVGPAQFAAQLHVVGRIGEHQVGAAFGQRLHALHAIALDHLVQFQDAHSPARINQQESH